MRVVFFRVMVWIILDGQIEGLLGNSFILLLCQRHYQTLRPDNNFRMYGNLILYLMRYTFRMINLFFGQRWPKCMALFEPTDFFNGLMTQP